MGLLISLWEVLVIYLGIDPALAMTGWAVLRSSPASSSIELVDLGVIKTEAGLEFSDRLVVVYQDVQELIETFNPDCVSIERFISAGFQNSGLVLQARGVILISLRLAGISAIQIASFTPGQAKLAVTGDGSADKRAVQEAIKDIFCLDEIPRPDDAADAAALAYAAYLTGAQA